eukprot:g78830.t1
MHVKFVASRVIKFDKDNSGFLDREEYKAFLDVYWKFAAEQGRFLGVHLDKAVIMAELNKVRHVASNKNEQEW